MDSKEVFLQIYRENIHREGADALLDYLEHKSDFFTAPASARFHGSYPGGLCEHSVNVYRCLEAYLERERVRELYGLDYSPESIALVSLLHDVCKTGCYKQGTRNVKGADGKWQSVPTFFYEDSLPYGHGEKSVYILSCFLRLTREEAMLVMRLLNLFLSKAQALNVRDNSDVAPAKALKQNIFDQFMKLDTQEEENDAE